MTTEQFEALLDKAVAQLGKDVQDPSCQSPEAFEKRVKEVLVSVAKGESIEINPTFHPHAFPDIRANGFGVEVKTVNKDSWLTVGNSVFEGMRDADVKHIYIIFGKMGGMPSVKWGRYEERITHVRISHAPRFVLEMDRDSSLFTKMDISYDDFAQLSPEKKMEYIRKYSRSRLRAGERLWWLEDDAGQGLPVKIRLYMGLPQWEKIRLRAEGALLCPQIVGGSRQKERGGGQRQSGDPDSESGRASRRTPKGETTASGTLALPVRMMGSRQTAARNIKLGKTKPMFFEGSAI